jgi:hypothetical protein
MILSRFVAIDKPPFLVDSTNSRIAIAKAYLNFTVTAFYYLANAVTNNERLINS